MSYKINMPDQPHQHGITDKVFFTPAALKGSWGIVVAWAGGRADKHR